MTSDPKPFYSSVHPGETAVLYIEDDLINQQVLQHSLLDKPTITIITATNLEETLCSLDEHPCWPDLIMLDNQLVGITGRELIQEVWDKHAGSKAIPLVMCTAMSQSEAAEISKQCQAQGFLLKPYTAKDLVSIITEHAKRSSSSTPDTATAAVGQSHRPQPASRSLPHAYTVPLHPTGTEGLRPGPRPIAAHALAALAARATTAGGQLTKSALATLSPKTASLSQHLDASTNSSRASEPTAGDASTTGGSLPSAAVRQSPGGPSSRLAHAMQSSLYSRESRGTVLAGNDREGPRANGWTADSHRINRLAQQAVTSAQSQAYNEIMPRGGRGNAAGHMSLFSSADSTLVRELSTSRMSLGRCSATPSTASSFSVGGERRSCSADGSQDLSQLLDVINRGPVGIREGVLNLQLSVTELCEILEMPYVGKMLSERGIDLAKLCTMSAWEIMQAGVVVLSQLDKLMSGLAELG